MTAANGTTGERLYQSLPAVYRQRDAAGGEPLRALLAVIEGELGLLERDIAGLYDNWFIETCDEWVVPYIGDLLDVRGLLPLENTAGALSQRAYVANTLAYRRRSGAGTFSSPANWAISPSVLGRLKSGTSLPSGLKV
jgi:hypothetical protein